MTVETLSYAIDDRDRMIRLDEGFYRFAEENGWGAAGDCLGRSIWNFVAGEDVQSLQRMLVKRVREGAGPIELPFRCDSPRVRREMDIRIDADRSGRVVLFTARLREERPRPDPQPMLDPSYPREDDFLPMCAWCDRFLVKGRWVEIEQAAEELELFRRERLPEIDHSICTQCSGALTTA